MKEDYSVKAIAAYLDRDRRTIEREIKRGTVSKKIENPYVSRNPAVPDYLIKTYYPAQKAQEYADKKRTVNFAAAVVQAYKPVLRFILRVIAYGTIENLAQTTMQKNALLPHAYSAVCFPVSAIYACRFSCLYDFQCLKKRNNFSNKNTKISIAQTIVKIPTNLVKSSIRKSMEIKAKK